MKYIFAILIIPFILLSCNSGPKDIPVLDFASALRHPEEFNLADYIDSIEYISLETSEECLLSGGEVTITSEYFYVGTSPYHNGQVYQFDRKGKFIRLIGKLGYGPEEYNELMGYTVSPDGRFVYIWNRHDVLKYDSCGRFIYRYEKIDKLLGETIPNMVVNSENQFVFRRSERAFTDQAIVVCDSNFNLIADFKREVVRNKKGIAPLSQSIDYYDNCVYYKEILCDTLYKIDHHLNRSALAVLDLGGECPEENSFNSFQHLDGKRRFTNIYTFSGFIYFDSMNKFPGGGYAKFIYIRSSGRLIHLYPNKAFFRIDGVDWHLYGRCSDRLIFKADLMNLLDNRDKLHDPELKRIVATMDENSNPVWAVVKINIE